MLHWVNCHIRRRNVRCRHLSYSLLQPRYRGGTANLSNVWRLLENILLYIRLTNISYFPLCCFVDNCVSSLLVSVVHFQCCLSRWYRQSFLSIIYPSDIGDLSWFWLFCLGPFAVLLPKLWVIWLSNLSILRVPDEGYSGNASCTLNFISIFLLLHLPLLTSSMYKCVRRGQVHRNTRKRHSSL